MCIRDSGKCVKTCPKGAIALTDNCAVVDPAKCVGCGMCEKVCPNQAIRAVRNPDSRYALLARTNGHTKRGGRTNLNAQRTLDHIVVGRISQMTDQMCIRDSTQGRSPRTEGSPSQS